MSDIFAVRNVDEKTREFIYDYAHDHDLNTGEALDEITRLAKEHLKEKQTNKHQKKYQSFFEIYDKVAFKSGYPDLSKNIDKVLYGKRD